ncbi:MAG: ABC transporter ATP-binding protein [Candidatus Dormibacteria bacterium]
MTTALAPESLLTVHNLSVRFGGVQALAEVSFTLEQDEILGVIGPNGAGKTTLFNAVSGLVKDYQGTISLGSHDLRGKHPQQIVGLGLRRTFQNIRLFKSLSVIDNVLAGEHLAIRESVFDSAFRTPRYHRQEGNAVKRAQQTLAFVGLGGADPGDMAASLPYGGQRRLEIARALVGYPKVLMLDEPAAGMNATESRSLGGMIKRIAGTGIGVLLVEHDMRVIMSVCDRIVVLNFGRVIAQGTPEQIRSDKEVVSAYLGDEASA